MRKYRALWLGLLVAILISFALFQYWDNTHTTKEHLYSINSRSVTKIPLNNVDFIREHQLVNLTDFRFLLSSNACSKLKTNEILLGLIIITSYVGHEQLRAAHRSAISQAELRRMGLIRIFQIAKIPQSERFSTQADVIQEHNQYDDLIQGNFLEAYRNLTYKHVMGFKWAAKYCRQAEYIVKVDDDSVFNVFAIHDYLMEERTPKDQYLLAGYIFGNKRPIRLPSNKWYVSRDEYAYNIYPPYLSGWLYFTNMRTAQQLVIESQRIPFFWIDDTYVTGVLAEKLEIELVRLNNWFSANSDFLECCIRDINSFSLKCKYCVGPNGGDNHLIERFTRAVAQCHQNNRKNCKDRRSDQALEKTCVGQEKRFVADHGNALVEAIKL